jgi:hypothetical protein
MRSSKKFNVHLCQKVPFVLACFQASAAPRPENSDSDEKDALFDLDTQIFQVLLCYFCTFYYFDYIFVTILALKSEISNIYFFLFDFILPT